MTDLFLTDSDFVLLPGVVFPQFGIIGLTVQTAFTVKHPLALTGLVVSLNVDGSKRLSMEFSDSNGQQVRAVKFRDDLYVLLCGGSNNYGTYSGCICVNSSFNHWVSTLPVGEHSISDYALVVHPCKCATTSGDTVVDYRLLYQGTAVDNLNIKPADEQSNKVDSVFGDLEEPRLQRLIVVDNAGNTAELQGSNISISMTPVNFNTTSVDVIDSIIHFKDVTEEQ